MDINKLFKFSALALIVSFIISNDVNAIIMCNVNYKALQNNVTIKDNITL